MPVDTRQHVPDILECLAQLSSDEVPTPPKIANAMLDQLPDEVWRDPELRWLDPCSKSGVFLREIVTRLLFDGLVDAIPDFDERREHILRNMVFGCGITELTGIISRRTVYYSRHAASEYSVIPMDTDDGNVPFVRAEHTLHDGHCEICGAPEELERGEARENYAYAFIHDAYPTEEMGDMKFDVIVGNPPYQVKSAGNTRTKPIYNLFVERAMEINPRYLVMITPSRWFAGGLGLGGFRSKMLADRRLARLVDYRVEKDVFPGVNINGGVSYFLWDSQHDGKCRVAHVPSGGDITPSDPRYLDEFDLLVRQNEGVRILRKVQAPGEASFDRRVSSQKPYDFHTNFQGAAERNGIDDPVQMHGAGSHVSWVARAQITKGRESIDSWKVFLPAASDGNEVFPAPVWDLARGPFIGGPGEICNGSLLAVYPTVAEAEAQAVTAYLRTRFVRFLVSLRKIAQHNDAGRFAFVPDIPMDREWTDLALYERYGITEDEVAFIESQVTEMSARDAAAA